MEGRSIRAPRLNTGGSLLVPALATAALIALIGVTLVFGPRASADVSNRLAALVVGFPLIVASGFLASKRPAWSVAGVIGLAAFAGTLATNQGIQVRSFMWLLLLGLLAAMAAGYLNAGRTRAVAIWPGIAALGAYLVFTALQIPFAETPGIGAQAFTAGPAFVVGFLALAFSQWSPETRWKVAQGFAIVALIVGAYAIYRLVVGHTPAEEALAEGRSGGVAGELSLFGSFTNRVGLGGWTAVAAPALLVLALVTRGRWRWITAAALAFLMVALLGSEFRTALIGTAAGIVVATALFYGARAFKGEAGKAVFALTGLVVAGMVGFALTVGSDAESSERFGNIIDPTEDHSFQERTEKWDVALEEINEHPLGQGLGTTGAIQRTLSHEFRLDNYYIDNSYLQIGVQQGYPGWILLGIGVLLTGFTLARLSVATHDRRLAALGIAASAALVSWLVCLMAGELYTSFAALLAWMLLGLGVGGFVSAVPGGGSSRTTLPAS